MPIDLEELKELCKKYDHQNGSYPESEYEGYSLFRFICAQDGNTDMKYDAPEDWVEERKI